jgi:hypothetical protein
MLRCGPDSFRTAPPHSRIFGLWIALTSSRKRFGARACQRRFFVPELNERSCAMGDPQLKAVATQRHRTSEPSDWIALTFSPSVLERARVSAALSFRS